MKKKTKFKKFMLKVKVYMKNSAVWRLIILSYFQLSIMMFYQLSVFMDDNFSASMFLAFVFLCYCLAMPILFAKMINTPYDMEPIGYLPACKYVGLYQDYKISKIETKSVVPRDLMRRGAIALVLSFTYDWPYVQIALCILFVVRHLHFLRKFRPYKHEIENKRCILNELTVICLYLVCYFYMIDEESYNMIKATTMKNVGFIVITLYTLIQLGNIILILKGAFKGLKYGNKANLVTGKETPDLQQFKLK